MATKRSLIIVWVLIVSVASVVIWQMMSENQSNNGQTTTASGAASNSSAAPQPTGKPTDQKNLETTFQKQVLRYYEISNTENRNKQDASFPSVATKHFLESYRWDFPNDATAVTTTVDPERSSIKWEDSTTSKNVRYTETRAYVIKVDTSTNKRYESLYPVDYTTWVRESNGTWKIYDTTVTKEAPTSP